MTELERLLKVEKNYIYVMNNLCSFSKPSTPKEEVLKAIRLFEKNRVIMDLLEEIEEREGEDILSIIKDNIGI